VLVPPGAVLVPPPAPPVCAEVGRVKGRVVKLRAKAPAKNSLEKSEDFIVMIPFIF
jgi:hypothetical protein